MPKYNTQPWLLDEETNFPLPIYPYIEAPTVYTKHHRPYHKDPDDHHFFYPRKIFLSEKLNPGGQIVRVSRIQAVRRFYHDKAHNYMSHPPLVENPEAQFGVSLLALLNFIPRQAIDLSGDCPKRVELSDTEYDLLRNMTRVDFTKDYHSSIGKFFIKAISNQCKDTVDNSLKEKLQEAKGNNTRRLQIENRILNMACSLAVTPLQPTVDKLRKQGEIPQEQISPYKLVKKYVRSVKNSGQLLADNLVA